jgi:hypothetical protein
MKPAIHESLSQMIDAARRLQQVIDGARPDRLLEATVLGRLAGDVAEMVHKLEGHAAALRGARAAREVSDAGPVERKNK